MPFQSVPAAVRYPPLSSIVESARLSSCALFPTLPLKYSESAWHFVSSQLTLFFEMRWHFSFCWWRIQSFKWGFCYCCQISERLFQCKLSAKWQKRKRRICTFTTAIRGNKVSKRRIVPWRDRSESWLCTLRSLMFLEIEMKNPFLDCKVKNQYVMRHAVLWAEEKARFCPSGLLFQLWC